MTDTHEFSGRSALVTGGTRGIGRGIADRLRAGGTQVLVAARTIPADQTADDVIVADVSTSDGVAALAAEARNRLGGVDIVVHNVGGSGQYDGGAATLTDDDWQSAFDQNLFAAVRLDRAVIPGMVERRRGAIIHVTSIQRRAPLPTTIPYAAAKAALTNYSKALANELAPKGIRVNAVCPGFIETESAYQMAVEIGRINDITVDEARGQIMESIGGIPLGAPGRPADVGELAHSWCPTAPPTSPAPSTSSTGAVSGACDYEFGICSSAVLDREADGTDAGRTAAFHPR